jgi:hypothetical protein
MAHVRLSLIVGGRYATKHFHSREPLCPAVLYHPNNDYYYDHQPGAFMDLPGFLALIFPCQPFFEIE